MYIQRAVITETPRWQSVWMAATCPYHLEGESDERSNARLFVTYGTAGKTRWRALSLASMGSSPPNRVASRSLESS